MTKFKYEDSTSVLYFFCFIYGLLLMPTTYLLWPKKIRERKLITSLERCNCHGCKLKISKVHGSNSSKLFLIARLCLIFAIWSLFAYIAFLTLTQEVDFYIYDPWKELGVSQETSLSGIKKKYYELSLIFHPDMKTGDSDKFMAISKAYKTLTNAEMLKTFYETGDPNGKKSIDFSIALPTWLSNEKYSTLILLVYASVFLILLPIAVCIWWNRSMKYSNTKIINETSQMYGFCLHTYPHSNLQRAKMILMCACEFSPNHSKKLITYTGEEERLLYSIADTLPLAKIKVNLRPFNLPFAVHSRILLQSYLEGVHLNSRFNQDLEHILTLCPMLWEHLINICAEMIIYFQRGYLPTTNRKLKRQNDCKVYKGPNLETLDNILKLGALITQRQNDINSSPLLQLPHVNETDLKHFSTKKRRIQSFNDIANLSEEERRKLLRHLSEEEYYDVISVLRGMPKIEMQVELGIVDLLDSTKITPGALVTVNIYLERTNLLEVHNIDGTDTYKDVLPKPFTSESTLDNDQSPCTHSVNISKCGKGRLKGKKRKPIVKGKTFSGGENSFDQIQSKFNSAPHQETQYSGNIDEDKEFEILQKTILRKNKYKYANDVPHSFPVHCPHFCGARHEGWWLYISDPKTKLLISAPKFLSSLVHTLEAELKFQAPFQIGRYQYEVVLISDSYLGVNCKQACIFTVFSNNLQHETFDYGLDEHDQENSNDIIEREETTSTEDSQSEDSGLDDL